MTRNALIVSVALGMGLTAPTWADDLAEIEQIFLVYRGSVLGVKVTLRSALARSAFAPTPLNHHHHYRHHHHHHRHQHPGG